MNPLLLDIPGEFHTERLTIRGPRPGDGAELNAAIRDSLAELQPWMPWAKGLPTPEDSEANIRAAMAKFIAREDLRLLVFLRGTPTLVASSGLHRIDWSVPKFEIGYWARTPFSGRGFVTEAVAGITEFARASLGARRVEIRLDPLNLRSRRVAGRLGFQLEGTLRQNALSVDGGLRDTEVYAKIF